MVRKCNNGYSAPVVFFSFSTHLFYLDFLRKKYRLHTLPFEPFARNMDFLYLLSFSSRSKDWVSFRRTSCRSTNFTSTVINNTMIHVRHLHQPSLFALPIVSRDAWMLEKCCIMRCTHVLTLGALVYPIPGSIPLCMTRINNAAVNHFDLHR